MVVNNSFAIGEEVTRPLEAEALPAQRLNITWRSEIDWRADDTSPLQVESVPLNFAGGTSEAAIGDRATPTPEIAAGTRLRSRYMLEQIIGRGGESVVFQARDLHRISPDGEAGIIAVKLLLPDRAGPRALERLKRAFWQMQSLTHPGIARVFDLDCDGDIWFMTMELVAGQTLNSWMQKPFSTADAVKLIAACCEALENAHSKGILHGDLKPANVLVTEDGGIRLIDFGSAPCPGARMDEGRDLNAGGVTPSYASPQVLLGSSPERCDDVFSLACLSYELLSRGGSPYAPKSMLEARQEQMRPRYDAGIPLRLFQVIAEGLALEGDQRPQTAREFLHRLTSSELGCNSNPAADEMPANSGLSAEVTEEATRSPGIDPPVQLPPTEATLLPRNEERIAGRPRTNATVLIADISGSFRRKGRMSLLGLAAVVILGTAVLLIHALHPIIARPGESSRLARVQLPQRVLAMAPLPPPSETVLPASSVVPAPVRRAPRASGIITFDSAAITASAAQPVVAIVVKRLDAARGKVTITWQVEGGTAGLGADYERAGPQVLRFFDGQTVRSLFIPLVKTGAATMRGFRSFTVVLRAVKGGAAIGPIARVRVTLLPVPPAIGSAPVKVAARD